MRQEPDDIPFDDLSVPEQISRVQDLWDQIALSPDEIDLTEPQRAELERRLRAHEQQPGDYSTWEQLKRRLEKKAQ